MSKSVLDGVKKICKNCGKTSEKHTDCFLCYMNKLTEVEKGMNKSIDLPMDGGELPAILHPEERLSVVGHCPCGAPIYGKKTLAVQETPTVRFSCECHGQVEGTKLKGMMRTT